MNVWQSIFKNHNLRTMNLKIKNMNKFDDYFLYYDCYVFNFVTGIQSLSSFKSWQEVFQKLILVKYLISMQAPKISEQKQIKDAIRDVVKEYSDIGDQDIVIQRMTGITNETYKVFSTKKQVEPLIYRKFGQASKNLFLDRKSQKYIYQYISEQGHGPKILAYLPGVRIEEFIPCNVLRTQQMLDPAFYRKVAFTLRRFHELQAPQIKRKSLMSVLFFDGKQKMIKTCRQKMDCTELFNAEELKRLQQLRKWVSEQEIAFLQEIVEPLQKNGLVFSHNDLLANNILFTIKHERAVFIDYEYSRFNYRAFDIGNYFTETQYDYDVTQPPFFGVIPRTPQKQAEKEKFIKCYCAAKQTDFDKYIEIVSKQDFDQSVIKEASGIEKQVPIGMMLCNIVWGFWAIIVSKNPAINFDYVQFAMKRMEDYYRLKKQISK